MPVAIDAVGGVTAMETRVGLVTVSEAVPLIAPEVAVIVIGPPTAKPVAKPVLMIVAVLVAEEFQTTLPVRFCVELSE